MKLFDAKSIQALDSLAVSRYGIESIQLMENAGRGLAELALRELALGSLPLNVAVIAGKGNNGGDGFVAARHLMNAGVSVAIFLAGKVEEMKGDARAGADEWLRMGGGVTSVLSAADLKALEAAIQHCSIIIDALFGTGLKAPVKGLHEGMIDLVNSSGKRVIAVDIPSGIDATTGAVLGAAINADITATMAAPKLGLYILPGKDRAGSIEVIDIGAPVELIQDEKIRWNLITDESLRRTLKPRLTETHKGAFGHLVIIAGSPGMTGAAYMAGQAAMRSGVGLATIALPESLNPVMEVKTTEVMTLPLPETSRHTFGVISYDVIKKFMEGKSAAVIGPGIGLSPEVDEFVEMFIKDIAVPTVIDASALNAVANNTAVLKKAKAEVVLTPHPGEMARLLNTTSHEVQKDRLKAADALAEKTGAVVVLKGAASIVSDKGRQIYINPTGNPGLATAGTGDILAGMIGSFMAQGYGALESACSAVYIHGLAGDEIKAESGEIGMMATDLLPRIPRIINTFAGARLR